MVVMSLDLLLLTLKASRVLDAGTGPGVITETVRALGLEVPIVAVDKAPGQVGFLARKDIPGVTTGWASVTEMVGQNQDLMPEARFTHALATLVVQFCGDRQTYLLSEPLRDIHSVALRIEFQ